MESSSPEPISATTSLLIVSNDFQQGVVEFQDFDGAFVPQLAQRQRVVGIELRQGARIFARGNSLEDLPVACVEAFPYALVDADRKAGAGLMKCRIVVKARRLVQADRHVEPRPDPFARVGSRLI